MGKKNKKKQNSQAHRSICLRHAASDAVKVLEAAGLRCVITGQLAVWLHGGSKIPTAVTLTILPGELPGRRNPNAAYNILIKAPGQLFQSRGKKKKNVTYYDPTTREFDAEDRRQCIINITKLDAVTPGFRKEEIQFIDNLPVISILPLVVYIVNEAREKYRSKCLREGKAFDSDALARDPIQNGLEEAMAEWKCKEIIVIEDEGFKTMARSVLEGISDDTGALQPLLALCQLSLPQARKVATPSLTSLHARAVVRRSAHVDGSDGTIFVQENARAAAIFNGAQLIVDLLQTIGMRSAILGNSVFYDGSTTPDRIDVIIFHPADASVEGVWTTLQTSESRQHFHFEKMSISKEMHQHFLYLRLETVSDNNAGSFYSQRLPINIFTPDTMTLPGLTEKDVEILRQVPFVPSSRAFPASKIQLHSLDGRD